MNIRRVCGCYCCFGDGIFWKHWILVILFCFLILYLPNTINLPILIMISINIITITAVNAINYQHILLLLSLLWLTIIVFLFLLLFFNINLIFLLIIRLIILTLLLFPTKTNVITIINHTPILTVILLRWSFDTFISKSEQNIWWRRRRWRCWLLMQLSNRLCYHLLLLLSLHSILHNNRSTVCFIYILVESYSCSFGCHRCSWEKPLRESTLLAATPTRLQC